MTPPNITFTRHDPSSTERVLDSVIVPVYEASHADVIHNPFYSSERFAERVRGYLKSTGFEIVVAYVDDHPVGQAFGYALSTTTRWWQGLTPPGPEGFSKETGSRTFAFNELMVVPERQGKGVAHALHDELLNGRREERATLLVREDNTSARNAYDRWGWEKIGKLQPYPDAPHFVAMIIKLPLNRSE